MATAWAIGRYGHCNTATYVNRKPLEGAGKLSESDAEAWLPRPEGFGHRVFVAEHSVVGF